MGLEPAPPVKGHLISSHLPDSPNDKLASDLQHSAFLGCTPGCTSSWELRATKGNQGEPVAQPIDPDLTFVSQRWTALPAAIRAGIVALVRAASEGGA
jgi:hypothetical protein